MPFHDGAVSGALYLMAFVRTGAGARFFAVWNLRTPALQDATLIPLPAFTVTDDRGTRYRLEFTPTSDSGWTSEIGLRPAPPPGTRWLDVTAPGSKPVRVALDLACPERAPASEVNLSPGELLLVMLAERLLTAVPDFPRTRSRQVTGVAPLALRAMAAGLGDIVAALEAADVLSPLSPVPARLATLCASLDLPGHGITAPPARQLPEPWLSVLAHYQRRKPDPVPLLEGYAAMTAALPELDGIGLTLLGLHHTEGGSALHVLVRGQLPGAHAGTQLGPLGVDLAMPLSIWLRDSGGRWHAARPADRYRGEPRDGECTMRLQLVPPLTRATPWAEMLAGGQSAEVRTTVPLRWGFPLMTKMPNEDWFTCLPSCHAEIPCGSGRHVVRWEAGALRLDSHADPEAELVLAALGGEKARCVEVAEAWSRHAADLTVLSVGPRGAADVAVSWEDVDAAGRGTRPAWAASAPAGSAWAPARPGSGRGRCGVPA